MLRLIIPRPRRNFWASRTALRSCCLPTLPQPRMFLRGVRYSDLSLGQDEENKAKLQALSVSLFFWQSLWRWEIFRRAESQSSHTTFRMIIPIANIGVLMVKSYHLNIYHAICYDISVIISNGQLSCKLRKKAAVAWMLITGFSAEASRGLLTCAGNASALELLQKRLVWQDPNSLYLYSRISSLSHSDFLMDFSGSSPTFDGLISPAVVENVYIYIYILKWQWLWDCQTPAQTQILGSEKTTSP